MPRRSRSDGTRGIAISGPGRPQVLVVEDDPDTQHYMRTMLGKRYEVVLAADAEEARRRLHEAGDAVRLVLMDISLRGGQDGLSLTRELRNDPRWSGLPIITVTAHVFPEDRHGALAAGCDDFVAKPFPRSALLSLMDRHLHDPSDELPPS